MPDNAPRGRVFDDPRELARLVRDSVITNGLQVEPIHVDPGDGGASQAGMGVYFYGRPNGVASGRYEKMHVMGLDVAARTAAAIVVVGTNTWGATFSSFVDQMLKDPKTLPITESGIVLPGSGIAGVLKRGGKK